MRSKQQTNNTANRRSEQAQIRRVRTLLSGAKVNPPPDPPSVVALPWNQVHVRFATSGNTGQIKVSDLLFNLQEQCKLFGTTSGTAWRVPLEFRLERMYMYSLTSNVTAEAIIFDPTNADNGTLTTLEDTGTPARPARVGYLFPNRVNNNAMYGTTESGRVVVTYASTSGSLGFYFLMQYRAY
jgi:hypothetical protein